MSTVLSASSWRSSAAQKKEWPRRCAASRTRLAVRDS
jgi:hypothetical protein